MRQSVVLGTAISAAVRDRCRGRDSRANLLGDAKIVMIQGAVHAYFGDYGRQPGDGEPTVPREPAQAEIIDASLAALAALSR